MDSPVFKPEDPRSGCYSKRRYGTEREARAVAARRMAQGSQRLRVYGCLNCGGYHLTHKDGGVKRG